MRTLINKLRPSSTVKSRRRQQYDSTTDPAPRRPESPHWANNSVQTILR